MAKKGEKRPRRNQMQNTFFQHRLAIAASGFFTAASCQGERTLLSQFVIYCHRLVIWSKQTLLLLLLFPFLLLSAANNFNAAIFLSPFDSLHDDPITKRRTNKRRTKCCCDRKRFLFPPQFEMEMNRSVRVFSCQKIRKWKSSSSPPLLTSVGTKERCHQLGPHCNNPLLTPIAHCPVG